MKEIFRVTMAGMLAAFMFGCGTGAPKTETAPPPPTEKKRSAAEAGATATPESAPERPERDDARMKRAAESFGAETYEARISGSAPGMAAPSRAAEVKAGAHDDNEEYLSWLAFLDGPTGQRAGLPMVLPADYRDRIILRVLDDGGRPAMNVPFHVEDEDGRMLWRGLTYASGENTVFTRAFLERPGRRIARVVVGDGQDAVSAEWKPAADGIITVALAGRRSIPPRVPVDVAFVLDATGSMSDEIQQLRDVLFSIHNRLRSASQAADLRFGMIVYRDRGDAEPLRVVPFTARVDSFEIALSEVRTTGGGDGPEDIQSGLGATLDSLTWRDDGIRSAFLIADAPPHTDYGQQHDYLWAGRELNSRAIRLHMIGASGLPPNGEFIFRQIAATSYGQFIFLTYGELGESSGQATPEDPGKVSHHTGSNWAARRLDDIVVDLVRKDLAYQVAVPLLATDNPAPAEQEEHLNVRLTNLWDQMNRQFARYAADTLTAVLLPFEDAMDSSSTLAAYLRDLSTEMLVKSGNVRLVERDRLAQVLREQELSAVGLIDPSKAVELGHLLNSRVVLTGKIYRLGTDRVVHVRAIDTETAQIIAAARVRV